MSIDVKTLVSETALTASDTGTGVRINHRTGHTIHYIYTDVTSGVVTFVDGDVNVANNTVTDTAHGLVTGDKIALTTGGVLPAGLSATNYFIIRVDANTYKFATTLVNAQAGTAVDITAAAGGGTHTVTPAALSGSIKLQMSYDGTNWADVPSSTIAISATGSTLQNYRDYNSLELRSVYTHTAGRIDISATYTAQVIL